jgi:hypothetical protein
MSRARDLANLGDGITGADLPAGSVLQVISVTKTDTQSISGTSFVTISGLSASITPVSTSSKILVTVSVHYGASTASYPAFKLMRGITHISVADTQETGIEVSFGHASNRNESEFRLFSAHHNFLDSPSTTLPTTYSIDASPMRTSSQQIFINRAITLEDDNQMAATSTLTLMEIAG